VGRALERLGYTAETAGRIRAHVEQTGTIEGAPEFDAAHLDVFDCSLRAASGTRAIAWRGHLRMMAAVQPFLSGAISKTINMPEEATVGDVYDAFVESWRMGLKAVAIYRDHCKRAQPLETSARARAEQVVYRPMRRRLPDERRSLTHRFSIGGHEGYITVGLYDDGGPGEIFVTMSKEGSTISGLMDCFATAVSLSLQYGVPLQCLVDKFSHMRFEPSGFTGNQQLPYAKSIMDYIFRWLELKFMDAAPAVEAQRSLPFAAAPVPVASDAPLCPDCGSLMVRNGSCYKCGNCGGTSGCS
jgi:ribonucleoside-diphosphate reductase alpha chain